MTMEVKTQEDTAVAVENRQMRAITHYMENESIPYSMIYAFILAMAIDLLDFMLLGEIGKGGYTHLGESLNIFVFVIPVVLLMHGCQMMGRRWLKRRDAMPKETFHRYVEKWIRINVWGITLLALTSLLAGMCVIAFIITDLTPSLAEWDLGHGMVIIKFLPFLIFNCNLISHNHRTCRALLLKVRRARHRRAG